MIPIAVSTGWLFAEDKSTIDEQVNFLHMADGAELSITSEDRFETYANPVDTPYLSFHISPDPGHVSQVVALAEQHEPENIVLHPDGATTELLETYSQHDLPISIENMDPRKESGYALTELDSLITQYDTSFTLDVQHAYEHDETMEYAWDLVEMAGDRVSELHVSGETSDSIHALLHEADNTRPIVDFLKDFYETRSTPLVIEGEYTSMADVLQEVTFLREMLS